MKWIMELQILVAVLVIGGWTASVTVASPPRQPGYNLHKLYQEGKDEEARASVVKRVRRRLDQAKKIKEVNTARRARMKVPSYVFFNLLGMCLGEEAKKGRTPEDVLKLCEEVITVFDEGLPELRKWSKDDRSIDGAIRMTVMAKANLLLGQIAILRDAGKGDRARGLAKKHEAFLKSWSVPMDKLCSQKNTRYAVGRHPNPKKHAFRLMRFTMVDGKIGIGPTYSDITTEPIDK
jgi:hypothetical protein